MSRYKRIPIVDLIVDGRYQRPLDQKRVERIAGDFDDRLFGVLEVNKRNGKAAVFDGQHRLAAAKLVGREVVPCLVHTHLDPIEEADLFVKLQRQRKTIQPVDRFRARLFAGEPAAVAIDAVVNANGFKIEQGSSSDNGQRRHIAAIGALERLHALGVLGDTLEVLESIWGGDPHSTEGWLIEGLGYVVHGYGHRLDGETIDRLREVPALTIIRRARSTAQDGGGGSTTRGKLVAAEIRKAAGLRGRPKARTNTSVESAA